MKNFIKKLAKKAEGFTLVELVVVIAILGILAGVAVPAYSGYLKKANFANDEQVVANANTILQSGAAYVGKTAAQVVDSIEYSAANKKVTVTIVSAGASAGTTDGDEKALEAMYDFMGKSSSYTAGTTKTIVFDGLTGENTVSQNSTTKLLQLPTT